MRVAWILAYLKCFGVMSCIRCCRNGFRSLDAGVIPFHLFARCTSIRNLLLSTTKRGCLLKSGQMKKSIIFKRDTRTHRDLICIFFNLFAIAPMHLHFFQKHQKFIFHWMYFKFDKERQTAPSFCPWSLVPQRKPTLTLHITICTTVNFLIS